MTSTPIRPHVLHPTRSSPSSAQGHERRTGAHVFAGKSALVAGAGRGIGRAIALGLAAEGANVALLARSEHELDEVADLVRDSGGVALVLPADMGDAGSIERASAATLSEFASVDILINNAAVVWPVASSTTIAIADWASTLAINVTGRCP